MKNEVLKSQGGKKYPATIKRRKANWRGHILRRDCLRRTVQGKIEERLEVAETRGRRRKQLLDDLNGTIRYWKDHILSLPSHNTR